MVLLTAEQLGIVRLRQRLIMLFQSVGNAERDNDKQQWKGRSGSLTAAVKRQMDVNISVQRVGQTIQGNGYHFPELSSFFECLKKRRNA